MILIIDPSFRLENLLSQFDDEIKTLSNELTVCRSQSNSKANKLAIAESEIKQCLHRVDDLEHELQEVQDLKYSNDMLNDRTSHEVRYRMQLLPIYVFD